MLYSTKNICTAVFIAVAFQLRKLPEEINYQFL